MTMDQPAAPADPPSWVEAFPGSEPAESPAWDEALPPPPVSPELPRLDWSRQPAPASSTSQPRRQVEGITLDNAPVLRRRAHNLPAYGWRRSVYRATRGLIRPGPSRAELHARRLVTTLTQQVTGSRMIAVVSTKGGVGKTSITINLGHTFAAFRGDRIVGLDCNPEAGSLAYRISRETTATASELLTELAGNHVHSYADVRRFTSQAPSRLEVIASPEDPRESRALSSQDYQQILGLLRRHFTLILADCGTGILDPVTQGIVEAADQLVVVTAPSIDAARVVSFLLSWLTEHGHTSLVSGAVLVINAVPAKTGLVNLPEIERHFAERVRVVVRIPWDCHLKTGAGTALEDLSPATRDAYLHLAAAVAGGFSVPHTRSDATPPARQI